MGQRSGGFRAAEWGRYLINGLFATGVHFAVLSGCLNLLHLSSAGLSNGIASTAGIACSFLGNRHFVFRQQTTAVAGQVWRFALLYGAIALLHTGVLWLWTDRMGWSYQTGFVLAVALQVVLGYVAGKYFVFVAPPAQR